ncbi:histidine kinase [Leptobacterium flavescens]|uniref:Histidine kinase n=1 Tax=Leptobacterium flavescens TaxID=472055 RepID=A0A6P0UXP8_9FLAO|nr:FecR family protein [Leptobacterium flavescens]NER15236.1 histidine kinase [Leptobacterium flavescens]
MDQENFLARWMEGSLSEQELQEFKKTEEYHSYAKIVEHMDKLGSPDYNILEEFKKLQDKIPAQSESKVVKFRPVKLLMRVAAIFVIVIGSYYFLNQRETEIVTKVAEQKTFLLPDDSEVILNAKSVMNFSKSTWDKKREVQLKGEAYFKVAKGQTFDVVTSSGIVRVVGTQFNVKSREGYFEVSCYEGIVKVIHRNMENTLTVGDGVKMFDGELFQENDLSEMTPHWINKESTFKSIPLRFVLDELERQYDISLVKEGINEDLLFSGGFTHNNLELALQSICIPLRIKYNIEEKSVTLYSE